MQVCKNQLFVQTVAHTIRISLKKYTQTIQFYREKNAHAIWLSTNMILIFRTRFECSHILYKYTYIGLIIIYSDC